MRSPLLGILVIMKLLDDTVSDDHGTSVSSDDVQTKMIANPRYYHDFCGEVDYRADETIRYLSNRPVSDRFLEKNICFYNISAPPGKRVFVNFTYVKLGRNQNWCEDRLIAYDQFGKTEMIESTNLTVNYTSQGEYFLFAFFVCDESTSAGFRLNYKAVPAEEDARHWPSTYNTKCGQRNFVAKSEVQNFTTKLEGPRLSDTVHHLCLYNITAPAGDRIAVNVVSLKFYGSYETCKVDFVRFFDTDSATPISICNEEHTGDYISASEHFTFIMSRHGFFQEDGIALEYKTVPRNKSLTTEVTGISVFIVLLISLLTGHLLGVNCT